MQKYGSDECWFEVAVVKDVLQGGLSCGSLSFKQWLEEVPWQPTATVVPLVDELVVIFTNRTFFSVLIFFRGWRVSGSRL